MMSKVQYNIFKLLFFCYIICVFNYCNPKGKYELNILRYFQLNTHDF